MRQRWLVQSEAGDESVEADEVEITASGVLLFYRDAARQETARTLLIAFSPSVWQRCQMDTDA